MRSYLHRLIVAALLCIVCSPTSSWAYDPDIDRNITEIIRAKGYPVETHETDTVDGFILTIHRIPRQGAKSVLLWPGLVCSSGIWILNYNTSIAYALYNAGYDVWMANSRTRPGLLPRHRYYPPSDPRMWQWSWDEIGLYDEPATIDYILNTTRLPRVTALIGHSQGGTSSWVTLTSNASNYGAKIGVFIPLGGPQGAPVGPSSPTAPPTTLPPIECTPCTEQKWPGCCAGVLGIYLNDTIAVDMCERLPGLCADILCGIAGCASTSNWNMSRIPVMVAHYPSYTSVQNVNHWSQSFSEGFRFYDFGSASNLIHYGTANAPAYNFTNLATDVAVLYGEKDKMCPLKGQLALLPLIPRERLIAVAEITGYGHLDFVFANDADVVLYPLVLEVISRY